MKKLSLFLTLVFAVSTLFAQKGKVNSAASNLRSGKIDIAKKLIDTGITHRKCIAWNKAYFVKGQVYQGIFESPLEAYRKLSDNPLEIAYEAYKKLIELDVKKKYTKKLNKQYLNLAMDFANSGANKYNNEDIEGALKDFKTTLEIENSEILAANNIVDTPVIYYTALAANKLKKYEEAIPYFEKSLSYEYEAAKCYASIAYAYKELKQEDKAVEYLHKGYELYPNDLYMLGQLINYYLLGGAPEKAETYLDAAIAQDPTNISFYTAKGTLYEKTNRSDDAVKMYEKALEINPNDYASLFNIALIRLRVVEKRQAEVNNIMDNDEYTKEVATLYTMFADVVLLFEKAYEANKEEVVIVDTIKQIYFKIRNQKPEYMEKYEKYKAIQEGMEASK
jgi:tetratricopeptide (TPR) repeat protein